MIRVVHPGSRILMLTFSHPGSRIPDPGVKKVPDPGSGSATLNFLWLNSLTRIRIPQHWLSCMLYYAQGGPVQRPTDELPAGLVPGLVGPAAGGLCGRARGVSVQQQARRQPPQRAAQRDGGLELQVRYRHRYSLGDVPYLPKYRTGFRQLRLCWLHFNLRNFYFCQSKSKKIDCQWTWYSTYSTLLYKIFTLYILCTTTNP